MEGKRGEEKNQAAQEPMEQEYHFMQETIKKGPDRRKKQMIQRVGFLILAGAIFGLAAAGVFVLASPALFRYYWNHVHTEKIQLSEDKPETSPSEKERKKGEVELVMPMEDTTNTFRYLEKIGEGIQQISRNVENAMVTVHAYSGEKNFFDQTHLNILSSYGIIIASAGDEIFVLTESDVARGAKNLELLLPDGTVLEAERKGSLEEMGIAVVSASIVSLDFETREKLRYIDLGNSYEIDKGESVVAIGGPMGYTDSIALGRITSISNLPSLCDGGYRLLVTNMPCGAESSGVLLNLRGEVIGVIIQKFSVDGITAPVVKAFSISELKSIIEKMANGEKVSYLGIHGAEVTSEQQKSRGIPAGVCVEQMEVNSPAEDSGIQNGDIITAMNGMPVRSQQDYASILQNCTEGMRIPVLVKRKVNSDYTEMEVYVTVGEWNS